MSGTAGGGAGRRTPPPRKPSRIRWRRLVRGVTGSRVEQPRRLGRVDTARGDVLEDLTGLRSV